VRHMRLNIARLPGGMPHLQRLRHIKVQLTDYKNISNEKRGTSIHASLLLLLTSLFR
jgi:hypothetical protein